MSRIFNQLSNQLIGTYEHEDYIETDLAYWKQRLIKVQKELETPLHVDMVPNTDLSPIYFLKLKTMEEGIVIPFPLTPPVTRSDTLFEDTNILEKKSLEFQLDFHDIHASSKCLLIKFTQRYFLSLENDQTELLPDPTQHDNLILLQISTPNESQLPARFNQLNDGHLSVLNKSSAWLTQLKQTKPTTLIIDMFNMSLKEQDDLLNELSQLKHIHSLYIRGTPPEHDDDREYFFSKYPMIKAMFANEQSLVVQWAMDTANEYRKIGDMYIAKGEKDKAQVVFAQGIALYKRLSSFLHEKRSATSANK
jgi:hypothetical protein